MMRVKCLIIPVSGIYLNEDAQYIVKYIFGVLKTDFLHFFDLKIKLATISFL